MSQIHDRVTFLVSLDSPNREDHASLVLKFAFFGDKLQTSTGKYTALQYGVPNTNDFIVQNDFIQDKSLLVNTIFSLDLIHTAYSDSFTNEK